jgi:uncharacterized protein (DUF697 family)
MKDKIKDKILDGLKDSILGKNSAPKGNNKNELADSIIRTHTIWSMGAGFIPILIADIFAVSALQLDMIRQLCKLYDIDYEETRGKAIVTSLTGATIARLGARSIIKLIPGLGSVIGGVTVSIFAGASTYALGEVFKTHFASGGTILDFDPDRVKKFYKEKFEKGKDVAKEWSEELKDTAEDVAQKGSIIVDEITDTASDIISEMNPDEVKESMENVKATATEVPPSSSSDTPASEFIKKAFESDPLAKLKELGELKAAGVITEEEFQTMKKKIIDDF